MGFLRFLRYLLLPRHRPCCDMLEEARQGIVLLQHKNAHLERHISELGDIVDDLMSKLELAEDLLAVIEP